MSAAVYMRVLEWVLSRAWQNWHDNGLRQNKKKKKKKKHNKCVHQVNEDKYAHSIKRRKREREKRGKGSDAVNK